ncbi:MAG TPA: ester cyclase [Blastocatellia bacterium]|nr:ester cyclase [Blastocatellia bacterium]
MKTPVDIVIGRYFGELLNEAKFDLAEEILTPDFKFFGPVSQHGGLDAEGLAGFVRMLRRAFPDKYFVELERFGDGARICSRFRMTGAHLGPFQGIPPTRGKIFVEGVDVFNIRDGKIARVYAYFDLMTIMTQLGAAPDMTISFGESNKSNQARAEQPVAAEEQPEETLVACEGAASAER